MKMYRYGALLGGLLFVASCSLKVDEVSSNEFSFLVKLASSDQTVTDSNVESLEYTTGSVDEVVQDLALSVSISPVADKSGLGDLIEELIKITEAQIVLEPKSAKQNATGGLTQKAAVPTVKFTPLTAKAGIGYGALKISSPISGAYTLKIESLKMTIGTKRYRIRDLKFGLTDQKLKKATIELIHAPGGVIAENFTASGKPFDVKVNLEQSDTVDVTDITLDPKANFSAGSLSGDTVKFEFSTIMPAGSKIKVFFEKEGYADFSEEVIVLSSVPREEFTTSYSANGTELTGNIVSLDELSTGSSFAINIHTSEDSRAKLLADELSALSNLESFIPITLMANGSADNSVFGAKPKVSVTQTGSVVQVAWEVADGTNILLASNIHLDYTSKEFQTVLDNVWAEIKDLETDFLVQTAKNSFTFDSLNGEKTGSLTLTQNSSVPGQWDGVLPPADASDSRVLTMVFTGNKLANLAGKEALLYKATTNNPAVDFLEIAQVHGDDLENAFTIQNTNLTFGNVVTLTLLPTAPEWLDEESYQALPKVIRLSVQ